MRGENFSALIVTHYQRILDMIEPDQVHIMVNGRIVQTGDKSLATKLEAQGYEWVKEYAASLPQPQFNAAD